MRKVENREEDSIGDGGEEWREEGGDRRVRKGVIPEYTGLGGGEWKTEKEEESGGEWRRECKREEKSGGEGRRRVEERGGEGGEGGGE